MRKTMIGIAAAVALGAATLTSGAVSARPGHSFSGHSFSGHSFAGRGYGRGYRGYGRGFIGSGVGLYADTGCWVHRRVWTPFGWRLRLIQVC